jgi:hypothetical protein
MTPVRASEVQDFTTTGNGPSHGVQVLHQMCVDGAVLTLAAGLAVAAVAAVAYGMAWFNAPEVWRADLRKRAQAEWRWAGWLLQSGAAFSVAAVLAGVAW